MEKKNYLILICVSLLISILFVSCGEKGTEWKGAVQEVDGVKVVTNPAEPLYGELVFDLEEDLSIGNEEDENYLFYRIMDIQIDNEGNFYILDYGNVKVQRFDSNGNFLCTFGGKGQGPGEFQMPFQVIIDESKGTVGVKDQMKLIIFDKDGIYLDRDIVFGDFFDELVLDAKGMFWGTKYAEEGGDPVTSDIFRVLVLINDQGQLVKEINRFPYDMYREARGEGVISVASGFEYDLFFAANDEHNLVYGYSKDYELNIIDLEGDLLFKIRKDEPQRNFTAEEKGKMKRVKLPEYKPYFYALFSDSEGRIYVQRNNARKVETVEKEFDIFSRDGYYLYKTICQHTPFVIKDGYYYTRTQDEDTGEVLVKRFKIKNWDQIKKRI